jgi:hypothetical protein
MSTPHILDAAGRPRSPATIPGYLASRPPRNKGLRYPADPPRVEEIIAVMRKAGPAPASSCACGRDGARGDTAERDPAPARARRSRRHLGLPAGNRQHRGDQRGPLAPCTDDAGQRGIAFLASCFSREGGAPGPSRAALPPRPREQSAAPRVGGRRLPVSLGSSSLDMRSMAVIRSGSWWRRLR